MSFEPASSVRSPLTCRLKNLGRALAGRDSSPSLRPSLLGCALLLQGKDTSPGKDSDQLGQPALAFPSAKLLF